MSDLLFTRLLAALDIAAFSRNIDGTFSALAPAPSWFPHVADDTFPFLGHILEEANEFWRSGISGAREFGPCAEVDASGREFHYRVKALTVGSHGSQFLVFELDAGSDRLRDTLQKARTQALIGEQDRAKHDQAIAELRKTVREILDLLERLSTTTPDAAQGEAIALLRTKSAGLLDTAHKLDVT
jgi:hypothetical protein